MPILINNPILSTKIFIAIFVLLLLASLKRKHSPEIFPLKLTQELKGLAILAVIFSHVGYFLSKDHSFLFPLSVLGGVGVNLFLFLSGYGLTASALKQKLRPFAFYKKRLLKILTPFWLIVLIFFLLDYFLLHIRYSRPYIFNTFLGLFPRADIVLDLNSSFWFLTPIIFYYLIFPLLFLKKYPWLTALIIYFISYFLLQSSLPVTKDVLTLYQIHSLAFPLGIAFASLVLKADGLKHFLFNKTKAFTSYLNETPWLKNLAYWVVCLGLLFVIAYTAYYSKVGQGPDKEQLVSLITVGAIALFFIIKKFEARFLSLVGLYSFEIYLFHWPIMSRYDFLFKRLPGWAAMFFYLIVFLALAWLLNKLLKIVPGFNPKNRSATQ